MNGIDPHIEHALEVGEKNAEIMDLIAKHCANARVELGHGWSMVEQMTGLPISPRTVTCDYARVPAGEANNLEWIASDFYRQNCVGCPHREVRDVPNLATFVARLDSDADAERQRAQALAAEQERDRAQRRRTRDLAAQGEPGPTRDLLRLIDRIDASDPDDQAAQRFLAAVQGAPELVTPRASEIVVDAAAETGDSRLLESVRHLVDHAVVAQDRALEAATVVLESRALEPEAVRLLLRLRNRLTADVVRRLRKVIVNLAGPPTREERIFSGFAASSGRADGVWDELFLLAYHVDAATVLATISELLRADDDYTRLRAAGAASIVFRIEPATVPVLANELVEALKRDDSVAPLHWDEASGDMIGMALGIAVEVAPAPASEVIERTGPSLDEPRREILFGAYDGAARGHLGDAISSDVAHTVVDASLRRLSADWGAEIAFKASDALELIAQYHGEHLEPYVPAIVGALLDAVRTPEPNYHPLLDFQVQLNPLAGLETVSDRMRHRAIIGRLRDAVSHLAPRYPEAVLDQIGEFLELPEGAAAEQQEVKEMRRQAVRILGALGKRHELLPLIVPHLYTALAGTDVGAKGEAITAWREIESAHPRTRLPRELGLLLPALVTDPYVFVHKTALRELSWGLTVLEEVTHPVLVATSNLAVHYASEGESDVLEDALRIVVRLSRRYDSRTQQALMLFALKQAFQLNTYDLRRFLESYRGQLREFSDFPKAILQVLRAPEVVGDLNQRDNLLLRELRDLRPDLIAGSVDEIRESAFAWMPDRVGPALEFVEVLQRGGCWDAAVSLANDLLDAIPDTPANAGRRGLARWVLSAATLEATIANGRAVESNVTSAWAEAEAVFLEAREAARRGWGSA